MCCDAGPSQGRQWITEWRSLHIKDKITCRITCEHSESAQKQRIVLHKSDQQQQKLSTSGPWETIPYQTKTPPKKQQIKNNLTSQSPQCIIGGNEQVVGVPVREDDVGTHQMTTSGLEVEAQTLQQLNGRQAAGHIHGQLGRHLVVFLCVQSLQGCVQLWTTEWRMPIWNGHRASIPVGNGHRGQEYQ